MGYSGQHMNAGEQLQLNDGRGLSSWTRFDGVVRWSGWFIGSLDRIGLVHSLMDNLNLIDNF